MRLYYVPYFWDSHKALIGLYEKQVEFTPVILDFRQPGVRDEFLKKSPFYKEPLLETEEHGVVAEASNVLDYLETRFADRGTRLVPDDRWAAYLARAQTRHFEMLSGLLADIHFSKRAPEEKARKRIDSIYAYFDEWFATRTWAAGDAFSIADCAAAPPLRFARTLCPFDAHANLTAYARRLDERTSVARVASETASLVDGALGSLLSTKGHPEMSGHSRVLLGRVRLLVVGGGPVGVAALLFARLAGVEAVALEAASSPLGEIHKYMESLTLLSDAADFEVGGLPFDCRDPSEITREEVLHYYSRVIRHGGLDVRCNSFVTGLRPEGGRVVVDVDTPRGPGFWLAENVLVTSAFEPNPVPPSLIDPSGRVVTIERLRNPAQVPGNSAVVIGGGASAYEQAVALQMYGFAVDVVARRTAESAFGRSLFQQLASSTNSRIYELCSDISVSDGAVRFVHQGERRVVPCDAVVTCIGSRCSPHIMNMLEGVGVLPAEARRSLERAQAEKGLTRRERASPSDEESYALWPDLWPQLFEGSNGVRLVGSALHYGGADAGIVVSIGSAKMAVDVVAGRPPPPRDRPLPQLLGEQFLNHTMPPFAPMASLRPVRIGSWTRTGRPVFRENHRGIDRSQIRSEDGEKFFLGPLAGQQLPKRAIALCDGSRSLAEVAAELKATTPSAIDSINWLFRSLFRGNILTWLPERAAPRSPSAATSMEPR